MSVRQTESLIRSIRNIGKISKKSKDPNLSSLEDSLKDKIGINVRINNKKNNNGNLIFDYKDLDQLNRLIMIVKANY